MSETSSDGKPGSERESAEFAERYRVDETTSEAQEKGRELEAAQEERDVEELRKRLEAAQEAASGNRQYAPGIGTFIIPQENTFAAHMALVDDGQLTFEPEKYPYSLKVLVETARRPDLFDPSHRDYGQNEAVRENLMVLFNDIKGILMKDGKFDPGTPDEAQPPRLKAIAETLGHALRNEKNPLAKMFLPALNTKLLRYEGDGAAHAYDFLLKQQQPPGFLDWLRSLAGMPSLDFNLPPKTQTAFSEEGLTALPPEKLVHLTERQLAARCEAYARAKQQRGSIDDVEYDRRVECVEHGRTILEWLRKLKLQSADKTVEEGVNTASAEERGALKAQLSDIVDKFTAFTAKLFDVAPEARQIESIQRAEKVVKVFHHAIGLLAKLELANGVADMQQISSGASMAIQNQHEEKDRRMSEMLETLKQAVEEAVTAVDLQLDEMDRQQQEDQDRAQEATQQNDQQRRRRRRRRRQQSSQGNMASASGARRRVRAGDLDGDGVADNLQGKLSGGASIRVPKFENLDLQQIRELGKALAQSTAEAQTLAPAMDRLTSARVENVEANERIAPDDVALSAQDQLKRERENPNPTGRSGRRDRIG